MGALCLVKLSKSELRREHRPPKTAVPQGLEPALPHDECNVLAAGTTSAWFQLGSEGLEPSPTRVRTGRAAANTLIPR